MEERPQTPPPVVVLAENMYVPEPRKRGLAEEIEFTMDQELYPLPKAPKTKELVPITNLKRCFSFLPYKRWIEQDLLPEYGPDALISSMFGDTEEGEIRFEDFPCERCGGSILLHLKWAAPNAQLMCEDCGISICVTQRGKASFNNCHEKELHDEQKMKQDFILLIKDRMRSKAKEGTAVKIEEVNERINEKKLSLAIPLKERGLCILFLEMYQSKIVYDQSQELFFSWDGRAWVKRTITWVVALVSTQLSDQVRWLREDLNTRLMIYKNKVTIAGKRKDLLGMATLKERINMAQETLDTLASGTRARKIVALMKTLAYQNEPVETLKWD